MSIIPFRQDIQRFTKVFSARWRPVTGLALKFIKKSVSRWGFRVTHLSKSQIEILIPLGFNTSETGSILPSALVQAGCDAHMILLSWIQPYPIDSEIFKVQIDLPQPIFVPVRARLEISELEREELLADLFSKQSSTRDHLISFFDQHEKKIGEMQIEVNLKTKLQISKR